MADSQQVLDAALQDVRNLKGTLRSRRGKTVRASAEIDQIRNSVRAWFSSARPPLSTILGPGAVQPIDREYQNLLAAASRRTLRTKYLQIVRLIIRALTALEAEHAVTLAGGASLAASPIPGFGKLVSDPRMQRILSERWQECEACVRLGAPLAAVVMIGGLLEGLVLARINQLPDKGPVYTSKQAPRDKSNRTKPINEWTLINYIGVAHDLGWITGTAKTLGEAIRDYRNLIHPQRELSANITVLSDDAQIIWEVAKIMMIQLLEGSRSGG